MISEIAFCQNHSSFWRLTAPTTDLFIRRLNRDLYDRDFPPMKKLTTPNRRAFVNEIAFELFSLSVTNAVSSVAVISLDEVSPSVEKVRARAARRKGPRETYENPPDSFEMQDIVEQHRRMMLALAPSTHIKSIVPQPYFPGCGIIDSCVGDVLASTTLYEIKAGDRAFKSIDVRQLLTYATLNQLSGQHNINRLALFNPRSGVRASFDVDEMCFEVSGKDSNTLFREIGAAISSGELSR
ncbi:MAG: hypothetical protein ACYC1L_16345 [Alphaproteobacteria bacterium]